MRKLKLEKITGVVALSYLILIPVGAFYAWQKVKQMDEDVTELWDKADMPPAVHRPIINLGWIRNGLERSLG